MTQTVIQSTTAALRCGQRSRGDTSGLKKDSLVLPQRQAHVLLHLLQAVVVRVDKVKGQRSRQGTAPSSWWDPQKPAGGSEVLISEIEAKLELTWREHWRDTFSEWGWKSCTLCSMLRLQSHCQVESTVSDFGFMDTLRLKHLV